MPRHCERSEAIHLLFKLVASPNNGLPRRCAPRNDEALRYSLMTY